MALTQVNEGNHTTTITYQAGDTVAAVRALVLSWLTGHGWTLVTQTLTTSDVFSALNIGGTPGTSSHYTYIELDYNITDRIILRQWLSWSGSSGTQKASHLLYTCLQAARTESEMGQPLSSSLGGTLFINSDTGVCYIYGTIPGQFGNTMFNGGALVCEITRLNSYDVVGIRTGGAFIYPKLLFTAANDYFARWSLPRGNDNSSNTTVYTGATGTCAITSAETGEYYGMNGAANATASFFNSVNPLDGSVRAGSVRLWVQGITSSFSEQLGYMKNSCRKYVSATGDIITVSADSNGIPVYGGSPADYIVVSGGLGLLR